MMFIQNRFKKRTSLCHQKWICIYFYDEKKLSDFYENHYNNLHLSKNKKLKKHAYHVQFKDSDFSRVIKNQPTKHSFNYFKNKNSWKSNVEVFIN